MDPQSDLPDLVEDLEVNIDELSTALQPLLSSPLHTTASSLPLLDKAKLYVLAAYSIESLVFSTLQASGVNAKEHAVFKELARLRGYFGKIKDIEARGAPPPKAKLDVAAAQRFIKHGLAGNERYDLERAERIAKEKARAAVKAAMLHKRFDDKEEEEKMQGILTPKKRGAEEEESSNDDDDDAVAALEGALASPSSKKPRLDSSSSAMDTDSASAPTTSATKEPKQKKQRKSKKDKHAADTSDNDAKKKRPRKKKGIKKLDPEGDSDNEEAILPDKVPDDAPKTRSETFNALLDGSLAEKTKGKKDKKGKAKARGK